MAARRRTSYAWARHAYALGVAGKLYGDGLDGFEYAQRLAEAAAFRSERALARDAELPPPLTIEELAGQYGVPARRIRRQIAVAREQLYSGLSDAGIRYRVRMRRRRQEQEVRLCAEDSCRNPIPRSAPAHRRYCDLHRGPAARVRRHRARCAGDP